MKGVRRAGLLLAALAVAAAAQAQEGLPCRHPGTGLDLPQVLGPSFVRKGTHDYEARLPGGGCSVRYRHPTGMWADVYIYRAGLGVVEDLPRDPRLMAEFQQAVDNIVQGWTQTYHGVVRDTESGYARRGARGIEVLAATAVIDVPGMTTYRTHVQLWSGAGSIWKMRATFPYADRTASDPAVVALGDALADLSRETSP